jgi:hypothetical protein
MADLEEHAFKRDRRFIVRLVLTLSLSTLFGFYIYGHLTSRRTAGCAADTLGGEAVEADGSAREQDNDSGALLPGRE